MVLLLFILVGVVHRLIGVDCTAAPGVIYAAAPSERGSYYVGGKGVYNYGYNTGDGIAKVEVRHRDGSVTGSYRYFDPLGRQIVRSYIADKRGFRVLGNELPVAPDTPAVGIPEAQILTGPVEGTQEFSTPNIVAPKKISLLGLPSSKDEISTRKYKSKVDPSYATLSNDWEYPYFYSPDNLIYDFPAGFAYHTTPVKLFLRPFGVTGEHENSYIPAGHTSGKKYLRVRPVYTTRSNRKTLKRGHQYIIGHAK